MREARQKLIRRLLEQRAIPTQRALHAALAERGFDVDQSTLSRDLRELGVRKTGGRYAIPAAEGAAEPPSPAPLVHSFQPCGPHLVVIRTDIGQAQPVALWLDHLSEPAIVATLAGDDTIFVATKNRKTQAVALRRMEAWFGDRRER